MKTIKASYIWAHSDIKHLLVTKIMESYFDINLIWTTPAKCDLLFIGPYRPYRKIKEKLFFPNNKKINQILLNIEKGLFLRNYKPLTIFYSRENERIFDLPEDFKIGTDYNYPKNENYLRVPVWKDFIDWSHLNLIKSPINTLNARRFGDHYNLADLTKPQGSDFMKKKRNFCCFFSYLWEPRKSLIAEIKKQFHIDGFGKAFDYKIKNHNESTFVKKEILTNYFANFCPENTLYPGWYTEKVPDAFLSKSLPITWADQNIKNDFNSKAFINLNDFDDTQLSNLLENIKDDNFLNQFSKEPLLLTEPNLNKEINFVKKILQKCI